MPVRINSNWRLDSLPTSSVSNSRSRVMIWETLATESFGRPVARAGRSTLPGASAQCRLLVRGTHTTLRIWLRFSASPWTTRTGLRKPGPEPVGSGRFAQYTWPWAITIQRLRVFVLPLLQWLDPGTCPPLRRLDSLPRLWLQDRDARCILLRPLCKPGFATSSADGTTARLQRKPYQESKSQFSYQKYNYVTLRLQGAKGECGPVTSGSREEFWSEGSMRKKVIAVSVCLLFFALCFSVEAQPKKIRADGLSRRLVCVRLFQLPRGVPAKCCTISATTRVRTLRSIIVMERESVIGFPASQRIWPISRSTSLLCRAH